MTIRAGASEVGEWPELVRLQADVTQARLVSWSTAGALKFELPGQTYLELDSQRVVRYGRGVDARKGEGLLLVDGSLWMGRIASIDAQACHIKGEYFQAIVPRVLVRAALLSALPVDGIRDRFVRTALAAQGTDDLLVRYDGDVIAGTLAARDNSTGLILGQIPAAGGLRQGGSRENEIALDVSGQRRLEPCESMRGIVFCPLLTPLQPQASAHVSAQGIDIGLRDGSRLLVASVEVGELGITRITTQCGAEIVFESAPLDIEAICYLASLELNRVIGVAAGESGFRGLRVNRMEPMRVRDVPWVGEATSRVVNTAMGSSNDYRSMLPAWTRPFGEHGGWVGEAIELPFGTQYVVKVKQGDLALRPTRFRGRVSIAAPSANSAPFEANSAPFEVNSAAAYGRISLVGSDGKIRSTWESERLMDGNAWGQPFDLELGDTVAIVLEGVASPQGVGGQRIVWADPVLVQMP